MTSALLAAPLHAFAQAHGQGHCREERAHGRGLTLAERIDGIWAALHADGEAECPICHARMKLQHGAGDCTGCGSQLS